MMGKERSKVALALTGIFLAGAVAGGFGGYAWSRQDPRQPISPDQYTERYLQRMITDVKLTNEQVECLRPMMEEFSEKLSIMRHKAFAEAIKVVREMDKRVEADLSAEQRELYHQMQVRDRKNWGRRYGGGDKGGSGGKAGKDAPAAESDPEQ